MKKVNILTILIVGSIMLWGCSEAPKLQARTIEAVKSDILVKTDDVNSYLSTHDLVNTQPKIMAKQLVIYSEEYGQLTAELTKMQKTKPDSALDELLALANEGTTNTQNLSKALADDPNANPSAFAALKTATAAWADYTDKSILLATGKAPAEATATTQGTDTTATTDLPGKGKHYGWWKNPNWANDPASRPNTSLPPGQGNGVGIQEQDRMQGQDQVKHQEKEKQQSGAGQQEGKGAGSSGPGNSGKSQGNTGAGKSGKGAGAN